MNQDTPHTQRRPVDARFVTAAYAVFVFMFLLESSFTTWKLRSGVSSYVRWVWEFSLQSLDYGPTNVWTPYPQGTQIFFFLVVLVSDALSRLQVIAPLGGPMVFGLLFKAILSVCCVIGFHLMYRIGAQLPGRTGLLASVAFGLSFGVFYYGLKWPNAVDIIPVLLLLLALYAFLTRRYSVLGLAIGVGGVLKLFPFLLLMPVIMAEARMRDKFKVVLIVTAVVLVTFGPFLLSNPAMFFSPYTWQSGRPPWQSWYSFAAWLMQEPHDYGALPFYADLDTTIDFDWVYWGLTPPIHVLTVPVPRQPTRWWHLVSIGGFVSSLIPLVPARIKSKEEKVDWILYILLVFLFWNIGWSPQYELFLIPLLLLSFGRTPLVGLYCASFLQILTMFEYPVLLPYAVYDGSAVVYWMWAVLLGRYLFMGGIAAFIAYYHLSGKARLRMLDSGALGSTTPWFSEAR